MKEEVAIYRPILKSAFQTAWFHRELWPLAALAGLLGTGTIFNDLLSQAKNALVIPEQAGLEYFAVLQFIKFYFSHILKADPTNAIGSFLIFAGLALFCVTLVIGAQHAILRTVHRVATKKNHLTARELLSEMKHPRFAQLILLNFFFKLMIGNLLIATGLLLRDLELQRILADTVFGTIFAITAIALAFALNVIAVLSLIETTKNKTSFFEALDNAYKIFRAHPVVCLEMSALLFGINFLLSLAYIATLILSTVPVILLFLTALETGSTLLMSIGTSVVILFFLTFSIACAGFSTTLTYSAWTELFYKIARVKKIQPRLYEHGRRLVRHFVKP